MTTNERVFLEFILQQTRTIETLLLVWSDTKPVLEVRAENRRAKELALFLLSEDAKL